MNQTNKRTYLYEIHFLRAIACLLVLLVHVSATYYYQQGQFNDFTYFFNQIGRFGTPIFALISGFLLFYQVRKRGFDFKKFMKSRFTKIGAPFFIWSVVYLLLLYYFEGVPLMEDGKQFLIDFSLGNSFYHLYFMSIVFQFYLLFPLLQMFRSKLSWWLLLAVSVGVNLYFLNSFSSGETSGTWEQIISQRAFLPKWIFFFIFGGFLAYHWEFISKFSKKHLKLILTTVVVIVIGAVCEYNQAGAIASNRPTNFINIPLLAVSAIGIYELVKSSKWIHGALSAIGTLSMGIYLVHPLVIYFMSKAMPEWIWTTRYFPLVFLAVLFASIAIIKAIQLLPYNEYVVTVPSNKKNGRKEKVSRATVVKKAV
ncbi:acyltransferase [Pseudalkalibacillus caeni]|uniref:Acyltransferase n=1 Tax=Exobacillus caeni TaxID=2574798 RepID=A0A5R9EXL6_9BACL|nr:acyltransferase [Pseudalkalibacillus caeni]TLS35601.1 acyltransferase [Pseudalkalibacillus caeni]